MPVIMTCPLCGSTEFSRSRAATSEGTGCLLFVVGLCLAPICIGIPVALYGLNLMLKRQGLWVCRRCQHTVPRKVKWYELG